LRNFKCYYNGYVTLTDFFSTLSNAVGMPKENVLDMGSMIKTNYYKVFNLIQ